MVVTASHYEAVRCAGLKKAAMIILIQRMRLARLGECLRPKTLPSAQCSSFNGKIPTINNQVVITSKKANITFIWTKNRKQTLSDLGSNCTRSYKKSHNALTSSNPFLSLKKNALLGMPSFQKSAVFLNIVQKASDPPPFYMNICPILQGVFFKTRFCRE